MDDPPLGPGPYEHTQFEPDLPSPPTPPLSQQKETVEDILDDTLVSNKQGGSKVSCQVEEHASFRW